MESQKRKKTAIILLIAIAAVLAVAIAPLASSIARPPANNLAYSSTYSGQSSPAASAVSQGRFPIPFIIGTDGIQNTVTVSGTGTVNGKPDQAKAQITAMTQSPTASEAQSGNAEKMGKIIEALKGLGLTDNDIQTMGVSLSPVIVYPQPTPLPYGSTEPYPPTAKPVPAPAPEERVPKVVAYQARNQIQVTINDLDKIGRVLDAATNAGADEINGIMFALSEGKAKLLRDEALRLALREADSQVKIVATELGLQNVRPTSINIGGFYAPVAYRSAESFAAGAPAAVPTPVIPGELTVSLSVNVVYTYS